LYAVWGNNHQAKAVCSLETGEKASFGVYVAGIWAGTGSGWNAESCLLVKKVTEQETIRGIIEIWCVFVSLTVRTVVWFGLVLAGSVDLI